MCSYSSSSCCCCDRCVSPGSRGATAGEGGEGGQPEVTIVAVAAVEAEWRARAARRCCRHHCCCCCSFFCWRWRGLGAPFLRASHGRAKQMKRQRTHRGSLGRSGDAASETATRSRCRVPSAAAPGERRSNTSQQRPFPLPLQMNAPRILIPRQAEKRVGSSAGDVALPRSRFTFFKQGTRRFIPRRSSPVQLLDSHYKRAIKHGDQSQAFGNPKHTAVG